MPAHRILIADDDRLILSTLGQGLRDAGYEIYEATDGKAAVHICETLNPELAILDMRMPGMSGVEAAHLIRQETTVPFIFLSAYNDKEVVQLAVQEGALAYLVKPVDIPQIIPTIEAALARAAELDELRRSTQNLSSALETNRETSMAIGVIMERYRLNRDQSFKALRQYARSERVKINDLAAELLSSVETFNIPREFLPKPPG
ncbi:MAG: response regulator [Gammaproteobacteria bacterium]